MLDDRVVLGHLVSGGDQLPTAEKLVYHPPVDRVVLGNLVSGGDQLPTAENLVYHSPVGMSWSYGAYVWLLLSGVVLSHLEC